MALLTVACILTLCARTFVPGESGSAWAGERPSVAAYDDMQYYRDGRLDQSEQSEFEIVMTSACGVGDIFGCGLLLAWRVLQTLLHLLENLVILALTALFFPFLIWINVREAIEKRTRKSKEADRDSFIGPLRPPAPDRSLVQGRKSKGGKS